MKRLVGLASILLVLVLALSGSAAALAGDGVVIAEGDADQHGGKISSGLIVWEESNSSSDLVLYLKTAAQKAAVLRNNGTQQKQPAVYGEKIVFADNRYLNWDIFVYDVATGQETWVARNPEDQIQPDIYGNYVVWQDERNDNWDIFLYDLKAKKEKQVTVNEKDQVNPRVFGDYIVWQDERGYNWDIYGYQISTGREFVISDAPKNQVEPKIDGNYVVWADEQSGNWDIYLYDLRTKKTKKITASEDDQMTPSISGDIVIWQDDRQANWDLYGYAINTGREFPVLVSPRNQLAPDIYGNRVVYTDDANYNNDIRLLELSLANKVEESKPVQGGSKKSGSGLSVELNGQELVLPAAPLMYEDRVLVPLRGIADALGLNTIWNGETRSIIVTGGKKSITLAIGAKQVIVGQETVELDTAPLLAGGRTYVPVRFVSEAFGAVVDWDGSTRTVGIYK